MSDQYFFHAEDKFLKIVLWFICCFHLAFFILAVICLWPPFYWRDFRVIWPAWSVRNSNCCVCLFWKRFRTLASAGGAGQCSPPGPREVQSQVPGSRVPGGGRQRVTAQVADWRAGVSALTCGCWTPGKSASILRAQMLVFSTASNGFMKSLFSGSVRMLSVSRTMNMYQGSLSSQLNCDWIHRWGFLVSFWFLKIALFGLWA